MLSPYAGLGLGSSTMALDSDDFGGINDDELNVYWNTFVGAKVSILHFIKPIVEYQYTHTQLSNPKVADKHDSRIMFGCSFSF